MDMREVEKQSIEYIKTRLASYPLLTKVLKEDRKEDPEKWLAKIHLHLGMRIRNELRENVCLDDELISGNWDDYYGEYLDKALSELQEPK